MPPSTYRPAIGYRPEAAPEAPPDRNWVDSNATVAAYNAMSLTMKMRSAPAAAAPAGPHAGHAGHAEHGGPAQHAAADAAAARPAAPPAELP